jgi:hypothetical protein
MRLHRLLPVRLVAVPVVAILLLAGCQSGGSHAAATASPTALTDAQLLAVGRQYSQCIRNHGVPDFPDLVIVSGTLGLPDDPSSEAAKVAQQHNQAATDACQPILDALPAAARKNPTPSAEELQNLLKYAQCLRQHGIPEWPDPNQDGTFPLSQALKSEGKSSRMQTANQSCGQYLSGKGVAVK